MKPLPRLSHTEVQKLVSDIPNASKWPESFFIDIFLKNSGYATHDNFSDRLAAYLSQKSLSDADRSALVGLMPTLLQHFRENGFLSDADYDAEYERCTKLLYPKV